MSNPGVVSVVQTSSSTFHEEAKEKIKLAEVWEKLEVAKVQLELLKSMAEEGLGLPQVSAIISKVGGG